MSPTKRRSRKAASLRERKEREGGGWGWGWGLERLVALRDRGQGDRAVCDCGGSRESVVCMGCRERGAFEAEVLKCT